MLPARRNLTRAPRLDLQIRTVTAVVTGLARRSQLGALETPTDDWACFQWVDFHKRLVKEYKDAGYKDVDAQKFAKTIFLTWWDKLNSFWGEQNWCGYTREFFDYFKSVGITEHISIMAELLTPVFTNTVEVVETTTDAASSAAKGAGNLVKVMKVLLPLAGIAAVGGAGYYAYNKFLR